MKIPQNCLARKIKEQLFFWTGENIEIIVKQLETVENSIAANGGLDLPELAFSLYSENREHKSNSCELAVVAESVDELKSRITSAKDLLKDSPKSLRDIKGIYFSSHGLTENGKIVFLFSGQASQRPSMLKDLKSFFPEMSESIQKADNVLKNRFPKLLSEYIYPPSASTPEQEKQQMQELTITNITQPALGVVEIGLFKIMKLFGVNPDMFAGHSLGEYVALCAAGVFEEETLYELLEYRGSAIMSSAKNGNPGKMLAVGAGAKEIESVIKDLDRVYIANLNSPKQTILAGDEKSLDVVSAKLKEKRLMSKKINVSCAFHSPYMTPAKELLFKKLSDLDYKNYLMPVYSNVTALKYPKDKKEILSILSEHLVSSVKFTEEVENMFKDGARVFIEIGPGNVLMNLVKQILGEKDYIAIASNIKTATDTSQILNVLAQLAAEGFKVNLSSLYSNL